MLNYETYIFRCLQLARLGEYYVAPNPMVGALIADAEGNILAEGWHRKFGEAHAEVNCFAEYDKRGLTPKGDEVMFVSLEPCSHYGKTPPCADLIIRKGIKHVVVGCLDPNPQVAGNGVRKLREAGIEVTTGILEKECRELNKRFITLHEKQRPYVILKWAQTADGYLGSKEKRVVISNSLTKQVVHKMRAENMSILVGTNTALIDNPKLMNTHWTGRNPVRILLDRHSRVPADYNIFSNDAETIVYRENTDWQFILSDLAKRGIHSILVEGGAMVLNYILSTGIYDEIHIEVNPNMNLGEGIKAPEVQLPKQPDEIIESNLLYTILK